MQHLEILRREHPEVNEREKTLVARATGRFYTHEIIGRHLVRALLTSFSPTRDCIRVVDPFCGEGRLIVWLLEHARQMPKFRSRRWIIDLWDCDRAALRRAFDSVKSLGRSCGISMRVESTGGDSFAIARQRGGSYDIVITNP